MIDDSKENTPLAIAVNPSPVPKGKGKTSTGAGGKGRQAMTQAIAATDNALASSIDEARNIADQRLRAKRQAVVNQAADIMVMAEEAAYDDFLDVFKTTLLDGEFRQVKMLGGGQEQFTGEVVEAELVE